MYLVFDLPKAGASTFPNAHAVAWLLHREFDAWKERHQIEYKTKFHKDTLRLIFSTESEYHFFMLSWNPNVQVNSVSIDPKWAKPRVVDPPKH
jgi:hypothetical protein